jgi:hypothetical protein
MIDRLKNKNYKCEYANLAYSKVLRGYLENLEKH